MKLVHVTIKVRDLDSSLEFYQKVVGLTIRRDMRTVPGMPIVFLSDEAGDTNVELIGSQEADSYSGSGISIGFKTDDIHGQYKRIQELGLSPGEMISPVPGTNFFFVADPDGLTVQFIED